MPCFEDEARAEVGAEREPLYRVVARAAGTPPAVEDRICARPVPEPDDPSDRLAEYSCGDTGCVVKAVVIRVVLRGREMPAMACPCCRGRLERKTWLVPELLLLA